jgi:hypothetical protein
MRLLAFAALALLAGPGCVRLPACNDPGRLRCATPYKVVACSSDRRERPVEDCSTATDFAGQPVTAVCRERDRLALCVRQ